MEALYHETNGQIEEIKTWLSTYEKCSKNHQQDFETQIDQKLAVIKTNVDRLDNKVSHEPPQRRQAARMKVNQLRYDYNHVTRALGNIQTRRQQREQEELDREELLHRKFAPHEESIDIGDSIDLNDRLQVTGREIDNMLDMGNQSLEYLKLQGSSLKNVQRKLLDFANTLGISNTVLRLIEKRGSQDRLLLIGGIIFTCVVMYVTVRYLRHSYPETIVSDRNG